MRALKTQIGAGLSNPGGPSKSDTTRLVQASEAQLVELLRQGYVLNDTELIQSTKRITENEYSYRALAANKVDKLVADDIITAIRNQPELLALTANSPLDYLGDFYLTPNQLNEFADIVESTLQEVTRGGMFNRNSAGERGNQMPVLSYVARVNGQIEQLRKTAIETERRESSLNLDDNISIRDINRYRDNGQALHRIVSNITQAFGTMVRQNEEVRNPGSFSPIATITDPNLIAKRDRAAKNELLGRMSDRVYEIGEYHDEHRSIAQGNSSIGSDLTMAKVLAEANPDSEIDYEFLRETFEEGYDVQAITLLMESHALSNFGVTLGNLGGAISDWWTDDTEYEEVDWGDLGTRRKVTKQRTTETTTPGLEQRGGVTEIAGFYPERRVTSRIENIEGYRDDTDYREDLEDGFYLDREDEGTGAVRRTDLDKTLFHEDVFPGKKLTLWNEQEKDLVSVYVYDKPEMLETAEIKSYESVVGQLEDGDDVDDIITSYEKRITGGDDTEDPKNVVINRDIEIIPPVGGGGGGGGGGRDGGGGGGDGGRVNNEVIPPEVPKDPPGLRTIKKKDPGPIPMTVTGGVLTPKTSVPKGPKVTYGMRMTSPIKFQGGQLEQTKFVGGKEQQMTIEEAAHLVYQRGKRRFNNNPEIGLREATREAINLGKKGLMNVDLSDAKDYPDNYLSISL